jgi:hypothetical protein
MKDGIIASIPIELKSEIHRRNTEQRMFVAHDHTKQEEKEDNFHNSSFTSFYKAYK